MLYSACILHDYVGKSTCSPASVEFFLSLCFSAGRDQNLQICQTAKRDKASRIITKFARTENQKNQRSQGTQAGDYIFCCQNDGYYSFNVSNILIQEELSFTEFAMIAGRFDPEGQHSAVCTCYLGSESDF